MADMIFGGVCRLTLASTSATWDLDYLGPGIVCDKRGILEVHTESGIDVKFDKRAVIGYQFLPYVEPEKEENSNETE